MKTKRAVLCIKCIRNTFILFASVCTLFLIASCGSIKIPNDEMLQRFITSQWSFDYDLTSFSVEKAQILDKKAAYVECSIAANSTDKTYSISEKWKLYLIYYDRGGWECYESKKISADYQLLADVSEEECRALIGDSVPDNAINYFIDSIITDRANKTAQAVLTYEYVSDYFKDKENGPSLGSVTMKAEAVAEFSFKMGNNAPHWVKTDYWLTTNTEYIYNLSAQTSIANVDGIETEIKVVNNLVELEDGIWHGNSVWTHTPTEIKFSEAKIAVEEEDDFPKSDDNCLVIRFNYSKGNSGSPKYPATSGTGYFAFYGVNNPVGTYVSLRLQDIEYDTVRGNWLNNHYSVDAEPLY